VDTRSKIVTAEEVPRPVKVVTGYFDVLRVEHVRILDEVRNRTPRIPLLAIVLPRSGEFLNQAARAEMAAALRMVDYVLIADQEVPDRVLASLQPAEVVHLDAAELRCTRDLIEHVHRGQTR